MADYDLGTAHGKIVVEYKDKGTGAAAKDLDNLRSKAKQLLSQFQETSGKYIKGARQMASEGSGLLGRLSAAQQNLGAKASQLNDDITGLSRTFGVFAGVLSVAIPLITKTGFTVAGLKGPAHIASSLGLALGAVPAGAENFPSVVKKIMQLSAAISLFTTSTALIAVATKRFRVLGAVGGLVGKFGGAVGNLAGPLHAVAGIAGSVAFQILQFRFVKAVVKPLLLFGSALGAVGGGIHLVAGLVASIKDLSGALLLAPAAVGVAGVAYAALKIGLSGLGDAFKAIDDPAKFNEAIKNLAPSAREFAIAVRNIYPAFKELKLDVQDRLFRGLGSVVGEVAGRYMPLLRNSLRNVAGSFNEAALQVAAFYNNDFVQDEIGNSLSNINTIVGDLTKTFPYLVEAFHILGITGLEVLRGITGGAESAAMRFRDFLDEARNSGDLKRWMEAGVQAIRDLVRIVINVGSAFQGMWRGLNGGEAKSFLGTLSDLTEKFRQFVRSAEGQRILGVLGQQFDRLWQNAQKLADAFFKYVLPAFEKFMPIAEKLSGGVIDGIVRALQILSPIFIGIATVLGPIAPLLGVILAGMVTFTGVLLGLAVAAKVVGGAIFILKSGLDTVKGVMAAAGFATRLLTGNLRSGELAALRFAGVLTKQVAKGLLSYVRNSGLIKGAGIAVALGAAAYAMDEFNVKAAGGADKLKGFEENLHDIVGAAKLIATGDFATIGKQFGEQMDQVNATWSKGEAPVQQWASKVKTSFQEDFLGPVSRAPGQVGGWLSQVGTSFQNDLVAPIEAVGQRISQSFIDDFLNPIKELPGKVGEYLSGLRDTFNTKIDEAAATVNAFPGKILAYLTGLKDQLVAKANETWEGWKAATEAKFVELGGQAGSLPTRIGTAIGSLIGMGLKWASDLWTSFKTASETKINEFTTWLTGLPARLGAWAIGLYTQATLWATTTWTNFKTASETKVNEFVAWLTGLPARIGAALVGFALVLVQKAIEAWQQFKTAGETKSNEFIEYVKGIPGRIGAALSALGSQLAAQASTAWNNFKAAAVAKMNEIIADVRAWVSRKVAALAALPGQLRAKATEAWQAFKAAAIAKANEVIAEARAIPGKISSALGNLGGLLVNAGRSIIEGLLRGIKAGVQSMYDFVSGIAAGIAARKGPISYDKRLLIPAGNAIIQGLRVGLAQELPALWKQVGGIGTQLTDAMTMSAGVNLNGTASVASSTAGMPAPPTWRGPAPTGSDGAATPTTNNFHVTIPAKDIAEMKSVADFFGSVTQKARAGKASG